MSERSAYTRPLASEDDRGPDSEECASANGVDPNPPHYRHSDCYMDYSILGSDLGFLCGCTCHDEEENEEADLG